MTSAVTSQAPPTSTKKWALWAGRILSALPAIALLASGAMKVAHAPEFVKKWTETFGFTERTLTPVGILELACVTVYLIPRTAVLGAILVACYFAGATCAHVRIGDPAALTPVLLGTFACLGIYLREARLRDVVPLRRQ